MTKTGMVLTTTKAHTLFGILVETAGHTENSTLRTMFVEDFTTDIPDVYEFYREGGNGGVSVAGTLHFMGKNSPMLIRDGYGKVIGNVYGMNPTMVADPVEEADDDLTNQVKALDAAYVDYVMDIYFQNIEDLDTADVLDRLSANTGETLDMSHTALYIQSLVKEDTVNGPKNYLFGDEFRTHLFVEDKLPDNADVLFSLDAS